MWCRMMTGQDVVVGIGGGVGVLDGIDVVLCGKPMKSFLLFVLVAAFGLLCQIKQSNTLHPILIHPHQTHLVLLVLCQHTKQFGREVVVFVCCACDVHRNNLFLSHETK